MKRYHLKLLLTYYNRGMFVTGGGALLRGIDKRLQNKIKLPVHIADDPLTSVVKGTGLALKHYNSYPFITR
ncbi:MAG: rod shape-determining protein [Ginsengibacter sp.]